MELTEGSVEADALTFGYLEAGTGPLALCLHGFPDSAWGWRHLLPALADAGFRAVAPFMRGYAPTEVPADGRYQVGRLSLDAGALHDALGGDGEAVLVGHDWGAMAAYGAAAWQPERWRRVVAAAVPPAGALAADFVAYDQLRRSWYVFFFQTPLADAVVGMDDLAFIDRLWADWSPGYDATEDLRRVKDALREPERLAAALGYYRAMISGVGVDPALDGVQAAAAAPTPQPARCTSTAPTTSARMGVGLASGAIACLPTEGSRVEIVEAPATSSTSNGPTWSTASSSTSSTKEGDAAFLLLRRRTVGGSRVSRRSSTVPRGIAPRTAALLEHNAQQ